MRRMRQRPLRCVVLRCEVPQRSRGQKSDKSSVEKKTKRKTNGDKGDSTARRLVEWRGVTRCPEAKYTVNEADARRARAHVRRMSCTSPSVCLRS